jgi:hypothetical protein
VSIRDEIKTRWKARKEKRAKRREEARADPDLITWPPQRSDVFALYIAGLVIWAGIEDEWQFAAYALALCTFAVVLPRMYGRYQMGGPEGPFQGVVTASKAAMDAGLAPKPQPVQPQPQQQPAAAEGTSTQEKPPGAG